MIEITNKNGEMFLKIDSSENGKIKYEFVSEMFDNNNIPLGELEVLFWALKKVIAKSGGSLFDYLNDYSEQVKEE